MAEAIDLATLYVHVVPSFEGTEGEMAEGLGAPLEKAGEESGKKSGKKFGEGFGSAAKAGMLAAGAAAALAVSGAFSRTIEKETATNKLAAANGLGPEESARMGEISGKAFTNAYGSTMEEVVGTADAVYSSINTAGVKATDEQLATWTANAQNMASVFEVGAEEITGTATIMMDSFKGMDMGKSMDLIAGGMQQVPKQMRGEVLPVMAEYATHWQGLGLTAEQSMGLIIAGAQQGTIGMDKVGDAFKEMSIKVAAGDKSTIEAFDAIGLNAGKMATDIAGGGPKASDAMAKMAQGILKIKDPAKQSQMAVALFGTPLEDLSQAKLPDFLTAMAGGSKASGEFAGAAQGITDTVNTGLGPGLAKAKNAFNGLMNEAIVPILPFVVDLLGFLTENSWILGATAGIIGGVVTMAFVGWAAGIWAANAALLANPITWVILLAAGLGAGIIALAMNWETATGWIKETWGGFMNFIAPGIENVQGWFGDLTGTVTGGFETASVWVTSFGNSAHQTFTRLVDGAQSWGSDIIGGFLGGLEDGLDSVGRFFTQTLPGVVTGGFTSALGIHSPSRVFAGYGGDTGDGYLQGLEGKRQVIERSMQTLVSVPAPQKPSSLVPAAAAPQQPGKTVHYHAAPNQSIDSENEFLGAMGRAFGF